MNKPEPRLTSLSHGGGCGCKIAPGVLSEILRDTARMPLPKELLVGIETADDAAVYQLNDEQALVATTDFFMPIVDDPFDFGRIAATNAISDVYAMGGKPILALALVGMPINVLSTATIGRILAGGESVPAGLVVCGVGAQPDVMLGKRAGLDLGETGGVRCDDRLRTSAAGLWAAGDLCEYDSVVHGGPIRVEHEEVAIQQGAYVARQWLGEDRPYDVVPYFFSDLADWVALESVGPARRWDRTVIEGSLADDAFAAWFVEGGNVRGYASFNGAGDIDRATALIQAGEPVDADALARA